MNRLYVAQYYIFIQGSSEGECSTRAGDLIARRRSGSGTTLRRKLPGWYRPQAVSPFLDPRSTNLLHPVLPLMPFPPSSFSTFAVHLV
jgi:hypothetical protein